MSVAIGPKGTRGVEFPRIFRLLMKRLQPLNLLVFRMFGRRMRVQGRPLLLLTSRGAKTGVPRRTTVCWFPDDRPDSWLVVGSNAGAAKHPAWVINLAHHPDDALVERDGKTFRVRAQSLHGAEREDAWKIIVELAPGFGRYAQQTDRVLPIIRLVSS
jgi:deazaflavin-dependent oxidoreductase (nitroreductase family)